MSYAGMKGGGQLQPYAGGLGDTKIAQQNLVAQKCIKAWTEEKKTDLRKYKTIAGSLKRVRDDINEFVQTKGYISQDDLKKIEDQFNARAEAANDLMKALVGDYREAMMKAGVTTSLGYNFYDLRGPAYLIYPVNTPLRNSLPRWGKVNAGYGTAVNWKYTSLSPGTSYAGAAGKSASHQ